MKDREIVDLYWNRIETAITETEKKYGSYCYAIANRILEDEEDTKESVNDTWMAAWNAMPPHRPSILSTFLGKLTRRISLDRWRKRTAIKRGGSSVVIALEELEECIQGKESVETIIDQKEMARLITLFLEKLSEEERRIFLCRYWYFDSIAEISRGFSYSQSKVTSMLHRTRGRLKKFLIKEGYL